ncbi:hypothetical protein CSA56_01960 [candidate division KSB3 bacterium]|uniref:Xylose isomerase-like TIM barrel domain-containing protein n=1 Tax=candidate division KSB3 bacterium TaxID=2044937 RepID=A0A2G6KJY7_9BACT|nr:MAG: hypothetical protein CSA56_01960 [candidate division KSB3 bacterium]
MSFIREVGKDNLKALLDVGHAHRCGIAADAFIRDVGTELAHVHLKDTDGSCDFHLNLGEGVIDFAAVFAALCGIEYCGVMLIESAYKNVEELLKNYAVMQDCL